MGDDESYVVRRQTSEDNEDTLQREQEREQQRDSIPRPASAESMQSVESSGSEEKFQRLLGEVVGDDGSSMLDDLEQQPWDDGVVSDARAWQGRKDVFVQVGGMKIRRRTYGILAAVFNGLYGGSVLAPMKFAGNSASGISFVISFGVGVL